MKGQQQSRQSTTRQRPLTTPDFIAMKERGERIVVLTAYDYLMGRLVDDAGIECVLVGDSLAHVFAGEDSTLPVKLDQMIYHTKAVRRGVRQALLVMDMPFLSYQISPEEAIRNSGRALQETGAQAVKLEGGHEAAAATIRRLVDVGIPVMGHLGLTPQSVHALGGYRLVGRKEAEREELMAGADRLVGAGCFSIVLEMVPSALAGEITRSIPIPTIGIGAGPECDGQVLVLPDMLGLNEEFNPVFLKRYADLAETVREAVTSFAREVKEGVYPGPEHTRE